MYTLLGLSYLFIFALDADAFSFSIFAINQVPIPGDVTMLLLVAGIVGFIGLGRRKLKK
jgi:hypothetical protein